MRILACPVDLKDIKPAPIEDLSKKLTRELCEQFCFYLTFLICANGHINRPLLDLSLIFADSCHIKDEHLLDLLHLSKGRYLKIKLKIYWRILVEYYDKRKELLGKKHIKISSTGAFIKDVLQFHGLWKKNDVMASKYKALSHYPDGTLGKTYYDYIIANNFSFPGEHGSGSEWLVPHDFTHILGGYNTDTFGELKVTAFGCAYFYSSLSSSGRGMFPFIYQYVLGINVLKNNLFPPNSKIKDFGWDSVFQAYNHGMKMNVNLYRNWDCWSVMNEQVKDLRLNYNI